MTHLGDLEMEISKVSTGAGEHCGVCPRGGTWSADLWVKSLVEAGGYDERLWRVGAVEGSRGCGQRNRAKMTF